MPMTNKTKSLFLVLLIVVFIIVLITRNNNRQQSPNPPNIQSQHKPIPESVIDNNNVQNKLKPIQKPQIVSEQDEIKPDKSLFYSDDPFINQAIIMSLYNDCVNLFYLNKTKGINKRYKHKPKKILKRITERFKHCQKVNVEHPDFYLDDDEKSYKPQSRGRSLLEEGFNYKFEFGEDYEKDRLFINELSQIDTRALLSPQAYNAMSSFHFKNSIAIVMNLIQSQQLAYIIIMLDVGQTVYNCNRNNGCGINSTIMFNLCIKNNNYCDLNNHKEYIEMTMSKGQQADLAIVVKYIETLFENQ